MIDDDEPDYERVNLQLLQQRVGEQLRRMKQERLYSCHRFAHFLRRELPEYADHPLLEGLVVSQWSDEIDQTEDFNASLEAATSALRSRLAQYPWEAPTTPSIEIDENQSRAVARLLVALQSSSGGRR